MSGLGQRPAIRLKWIAPLRTERVTERPADLPYVGLENVESWTGRMVSASAKEEPQSEGEESNSAVGFFRPGDVLFGKLRPYLAKAFVAGHEGICSTEFLVLTPTEGLDRRFLLYILLSPSTVSQVDASAFGARMPRADWGFVGNMNVSIPPRKEQEAIASFLDRETAKIDAAIAARENLLELLAEKRSALITNAVTRGLVPPARTRDSGLPCVGCIPSHWRVAGFTKYLRSLVDYRGRTPEKSASGVFLVTARNIRSGRIDYDASQEYIEVDAYEETMQRGRPRKGDLLLTTEAPLGQAALVDREDIALAQRVIKLDYDPQVLLNEYALQWILSAPFQWQLSSYSTGSTALGIKAERLHLLRNVIPPVDEQIAIVGHIRREASKLEALQTATESTIGLLEERRSALIAEAVTGMLPCGGGEEA